MAYFSLHAYDADVWLPQFRGLNQADVGLNPDVRFAAEEYNLETPHGVLQPQAAIEMMSGSFPSKVETLAVFHRRWYEGPGSHNWYIAASGGKLYQKQEGTPDSWVQIDMPTGISSFESNVWSWATYEIPVTEEIDGETVTKTVDIVLISNASDGMFMIVPPDAPSIWQDALSDTWNDALSGTWGDDLSPDWHIRMVDTRADPDDEDEPQKKFGVIERFAERIWGTAVPGEPDTLYYSKPYDPTDWTADADTPEDGAGEVQQPSWDGDQFYALRRFGDQLLAFKRNRIWRVTGISPGEYVFQEQYGKGTEFFNTIAVHSERVFMADREGVHVYDGMSTSPYAKEQIEQLWKTVNMNAIDQICAAVFQNRYYLAFPTDGSAYNNAMLVYDMEESNILLYKGICIESFLPANDRLFATSSTAPGRIIQITRDSWTMGAASGAATKWVSPWMDFGYKRIQKGGFDFYFIPEVQDEAVPLTISIQTEKKTKTKTYVCQPLSESDKAAEKEHRMKRLHFGGSGRKFRIIIETAEGITAPWRILGGLQIVVETDPD